MKVQLSSISRLFSRKVLDKVKRNIAYYSLYVIISVGYPVKLKRETNFRIPIFIIQFIHKIINSFVYVIFILEYCSL